MSWRDFFNQLIPGSVLVLIGLFIADFYASQKDMQGELRYYFLSQSLPGHFSDNTKEDLKNPYIAHIGIMNIGDSDLSDFKISISELEDEILIDQNDGKSQSMSLETSGADVQISSEGTIFKLPPPSKIQDRSSLVLDIDSIASGGSIKITMFSQSIKMPKIYTNKNNIWIAPLNKRNTQPKDYYNYKLAILVCVVFAAIALFISFDRIYDRARGKVPMKIADRGQVDG